MTTPVAFRSWLATSRRCVSRRRDSIWKREYAAPAYDVQDDLKDEQQWGDFKARRHARKELVDLFTEYGSTQTRDNSFRAHHSLHRPPAPSETTLSALMASGAHLGHNSSLMNPNFVPYAYGTRAGITIIDLDYTLPLFRRAANVTRAIAARGGSIVFVGTRPDLRKVVEKAAERMGIQSYHVGERWLPGTLTNKLEVYGFDTYSKIRIVPDLVIFLNPLHNMNAIRECAIEHIPTIGIVDSNADPRIVMYPIPANDESTRTAEMVAGVLSIAGREGITLFDKSLNELGEKSSEERRDREEERARRRAHHTRFDQQASQSSVADNTKSKEQQDAEALDDYILTGWQYGSPLDNAAATTATTTSTTVPDGGVAPAAATSLTSSDEPADASDDKFAPIEQAAAVQEMQDAEEIEKPTLSSDPDSNSQVSR